MAATARLTLTGTEPLLMHNGRLSNPIDPAAKALARIKGKRNKTDEDYEEYARLDFVGGLYHVKDVGPYIPGENIWSALYVAAKKSKRGVKVRESLFPLTDINPLAYPGPRTIDALWADENYRHYASVVIQRVRIMRCRPLFRNGWRVSADFNVDTSQLTLEEVSDIADTAGMLVGLGDWRPRFGRFTAIVEEVQA